MNKATLIVATDRLGGIGKNNSIPFKSDLSYFKEQTMGGVVIMGKKTWESLGDKSPLPGRTNIIVSTTFPDGRWSKEPGDPYFYVCKTPEHAIKIAEEFEKGKPIFFIGGSKIYADAINKKLVSQVLLTKFSEAYECDTFFPFTLKELADKSKSFKIFENAEDGAYIRIRYELGVPNN